MMEEVTYRNLKFAIYNDRNHFISSRIRVGETWEETQLLFIIAEIAKDGGVMVDVGGDIGTYSVVLSRYFDKVYCFEPHLDNFNMIVHNLNINDIENVIVVNCACSDVKGTCTMETPNKNQIAISDEGEINVVRLDDVIGFDINFLKVDVEGHEYSVLKGAENLLRNSNPYVYLETHPSIVADSKDNCEEFLQSLGYKEVAKFTELDKLWYKL